MKASTSELWAVICANRKLHAEATDLLGRLTEEQVRCGIYKLLADTLAGLDVSTAKCERALAEHAEAEGTC